MKILARSSTLCLGAAAVESSPARERYRDIEVYDIQVFDFVTAVTKMNKSVLDNLIYLLKSAVAT